MEWLKKLLGQGQKNTEVLNNKTVVIPKAEPQTVRQSGMLRGKYYTEYIEQIKELKRQENHSEAISLLLDIVDVIEKESKEKQWSVAPWYYEQLAIIYRKEKRFADEVEILERYASQIKGGGVGAEKLAKRLVKARKLALAKSQKSNLTD